MSLEKKLLRKYFSEEMVEEILESRMTPLRKYITSIGMDWSKLSAENIKKIADSQAYKQFRKLNTIKYAYKKKTPILNTIKYHKEDYESPTPKEYEPSKAYKHLSNKHIAAQQYYAGLINKGYSALKTAPLYKSVGPKGYKARKPGEAITFKKTGVSPTGAIKTVASITKRALHKRKEYTGKSATFESTNTFNESNGMVKKSVPRTNYIKEIKPKDDKQCEKEFIITKTLSGVNSPDTIQINPNMKIIKKLDTDSKKKKDQTEKDNSEKDSND